MRVSFDKVEVIIMGGTFPAMPSSYQEGFVQDTFMALNDFGEMFLTDAGIDIKKFKDFFELPGNFMDKERVARVQQKLLKSKRQSSLKEEKKQNETARVRCVGLTLESRVFMKML